LLLLREREPAESPTAPLLLLLLSLIIVTEEDSCILLFVNQAIIVSKLDCTNYDIGASKYCSRTLAVGGAVFTKVGHPTAPSQKDLVVSRVLEDPVIDSHVPHGDR